NRDQAEREAPHTGVDRRQRASAEGDGRRGLPSPSGHLWTSTPSGIRASYCPCDALRSTPVSAHAREESRHNHPIGLPLLLALWEGLCDRGSFKAEDALKRPAKPPVEGDSASST